MKPLVRVALPWALVTVTLYAPAARAGKVAVTVVAFTTTTLVAAVVPTVTVVVPAPGAVKLVPVRVTALGWAAVPIVTERLVSVAGGA